MNNSLEKHQKTVLKQFKQMKVTTGLPEDTLDPVKQEEAIGKQAEIGTMPMNNQALSYRIRYNRMMKAKESKRCSEGMEQDGKQPPIVTDEEESCETTSICDEDARADRCSSDTASAPRPVDKILSEGQRTEEHASETSQPSILDSDESSSRNLAPPLNATVPPPPPLVTSKPSQMSPKVPFKDRMSMPPSGSITQGTPVNQQSIPVSVTNLSPSRHPTSNPHSRQEAKSPRDRPVVEGLEKTLMDMHQRPRSYGESGHNLSSPERSRSNKPSTAESENQTTNVSASRDRAYGKEEEERCHSGSSESQTHNDPSPSQQQSDLDNEASEIPQADSPRSRFTAADLINALIDRQINQNQGPSFKKQFRRDPSREL